MSGARPDIFVYKSRLGVAGEIQQLPVSPPPADELQSDW
jgi:hypothetical protein